MKKLKLNRKTVKSWLAAIGCSLLIGMPLQAQEEASDLATPPSPPVFKENQLIVKFKKGKQLGEIDSLNKKLRTQSKKVLSQRMNAHLVEVPAGESVESMIEKYRKSGAVDFAEPDFEISLNATPNDPLFLDGSQWALRNTGQAGKNDPKVGVFGVDIHASEAWDIQPSAENIIVAVIDTGIRYTHQDLKNSMWKNPGETGLDAQGRDKATNKVDDDGNGYIDDVYGINSIKSKNGDPKDDHGHGSHCAGVIGASSNDGLGMTGIAPKVKLMGCKFLSASGSGTTSDAIECVEYARKMGAHIMSNSWGGGGYSQALRDSIESARQVGIIFVAAAGNNGQNIDVAAHYPSSYLLDNIVAVGAISRDGTRPSWSNYGSGTVNLFAPGNEIVSCIKSSDTAYAAWSGTSMATPQVAGALALMKAHFPADSYSQLINRLCRGVETSTDAALQARYGAQVQSKGRLNVAKALVCTNTRPLGDDIAEAIVLTKNSATGRASNQGATKEVGELDHAGVAGGHSVWFRWVAKASGNVRISTEGSAVDTVMAVYSASNPKGLPLGSNDDANGKKTSYVTIPVQSGKGYLIAVDGKSGETGTVAVHVDLPPPNDDFSNRQLISGANIKIAVDNSGASVEVGEPDKAGFPSARSIWFSWVAPSTGTYLFETYGGLKGFDTMLGVYEGDQLTTLIEKGSNDDRGTSSAPTDRKSLVTIPVVMGTTYQISVDGWNGAVGSTFLRVYPEGAVPLK